MLKLNKKMRWSANTGEPQDDTGCNKSSRCASRKPIPRCPWAAIVMPDTPPHAAFPSVPLAHVLKQCYEGDHLYFYGSSDPIICPHASGHQSVSLDAALFFFFFRFPRCPLISPLSTSRTACTELCHELLCWHRRQCSSSGHVCFRWRVLIRVYSWTRSCRTTCSRSLD